MRRLFPAILLVPFLLAAAIPTNFIGQVMLPADYWKCLKPGGPIEKKHAPPGPHATEWHRFPGPPEWILCLPRDKGPHPVVIFLNGTATPVKYFPQVLQHLASWGFAVIGNDTPNTASGRDAILALDLLRRLNADPRSRLKGRIDLSRVGLNGHSQGGVGCIHAIQRAPAGTFKAVFTASMPGDAQLRAWKFNAWICDVSRLRVPWFQMAATGLSDARGIAPAASLVHYYDALPVGTPALRARRRECSHASSNIGADAYMTAWFRFHLLGDRAANPVPEILRNPNWVDAAAKGL